MKQQSGLKCWSNIWKIWKHYKDVFTMENNRSKRSIKQNIDFVLLFIIMHVGALQMTGIFQLSLSAKGESRNPAVRSSNLPELCECPFFSTSMWIKARYSNASISYLLVKSGQSEGFIFKVCLFPDPLHSSWDAKCTLEIWRQTRGNF